MRWQDREDEGATPTICRIYPGRTRDTVIQMSIQGQHSIQAQAEILLLEGLKQIGVDVKETSGPGSAATPTRPGEVVGS